MPGTQQEFVDAYAHCGLRKYQPLPALKRAMELAHVSRAVLVQHIGEYDNNYIHSIITHDPGHFAGAFLVDTTAADTLEQIRYWKHQGFRGIRLSLESLQTAGPLWSEAFRLGLNIIIYSPSAIGGYLRFLEEFLENHKTARIILAHLGFPDLPHDPHLRLYAEIFRLANYPQVHFQVSGMHMFCEYPYQPLWQVLQDAAVKFGPDKLLWGSNFPVLGDDQEYCREVEFARQSMDSRTINNFAHHCTTNALNLWFPVNPK